MKTTFRIGALAVAAVTVLGVDARQVRAGGA
jgi:hypothetical protein